MTQLRILMLGNSFIFVNDLPSILAELTGAEVVHHTRGGARLAEQLNPATKMGGLTQAALQNEKWDYVINTTIGRFEKIEKINTGVQTAFDGQKSTWERVKGGFSALNTFNSNMNFTKGFGNAGKATGVIDKSEKTVETIWLQFAN